MLFKYVNMLLTLLHLWTLIGLSWFWFLPQEVQLLGKQAYLSS